ncbi:chorismate-binding protein [Paraburkholderia sp. GAS32]|uniref:chorismate-binding protein n=1 Tax=Paraburkholderia sp. GAS32 TaxID=3035129 RepID=UPI003D1EE820
MNQRIIKFGADALDAASLAHSLSPDDCLVFERFSPTTRQRSVSIVGLRWRPVSGESFQQTFEAALAAAAHDSELLNLIICGHESTATLDRADDFPAFAVFQVAEYLEIDHEAGTVRHKSSGDVSVSLEVLEKAIAVATMPEHPSHDRQENVGAGWAIDTDFDTYEARVRAIQEAISRGQIIGAVLSVGMSRATRAAPLQVYKEMIRINPSTFGYCVTTEGRALIGSSPLRFLDFKDGHVNLETDAGTRPITGNIAIDALAREDLLSNPKDAAEHAVVVDEETESLVRLSGPNGVTRIIDREVRAFSHVMHLYTVLSAQVQAQVGLVGAVLGLFPPAAVSGRPRGEALRLGVRVEGRTRGVYGGIIGLTRGAANAEIAVVIRSMWICRGVAHLRVGGKIIADSIAQDEYAEAKNKASFLIAALHHAEQSD